MTKHKSLVYEHITGCQQGLRESEPGSKISHLDSQVYCLSLLLENLLKRCVHVIISMQIFIHYDEGVELLK